MRIFHMADLHIGKKLNHASLLEDQKDMLDKVIGEMQRRRPDVLLLAGDIYDRRNPAIEAMDLLDAFLSKAVLECGVPVLMISGNHDSGERLGFANHLLEKAGLYIAGRFSLPIKRVTLFDAYGPVHFYLLPYADLATLRYELHQEDLSDYQQAMAEVMQEIAKSMEDGARHVLVTHGVVISQENKDALLRSDSERELTIGGTENWTSALLEQFDYVALGHLHNSQTSGTKRIRYAGSLLKYSFSEEHQKKGIVQIDLMEPKTTNPENIAIERIALEPLRDLRTIQGQLMQLIAPDVVAAANAEDYIRAILTDRCALLEPMAQLKAYYPNILTLERPAAEAKEGQEELVPVNLKQQTPQILFQQFYQQLTEEEIPEEELEILQEIFHKAEEADVCGL